MPFVSRRPRRSRSTVRFAIAAALALFAAHPGWAFDPFVVRDIRVEGVQRTEPGTVFSYLPVKVGDTLTEEKSSEAVRALFATGFFRDVRLVSIGGGADEIMLSIICRLDGTLPRGEKR